MELSVSTSSATRSNYTQPTPENVQQAEAVDSGELLRGRNEIRISHGGAIYSLRQTRQGKLILTK